MVSAEYPIRSGQTEAVALSPFLERTCFIQADCRTVRYCQGTRERRSDRHHVIETSEMLIKA